MEVQQYKNIPDHNIATYIRTYMTTYNSNLVELYISWIFLEHRYPISVYSYNISLIELGSYFSNFT